MAGMPEACSSPCNAEAGAIEVLAYGSAVAFFRSDLAPRPGDQETGPPALFVRRQRREVITWIFGTVGGEVILYQRSASLS